MIKDERFNMGGSAPDPDRYKGCKLAAFGIAASAAAIVGSVAYVGWHVVMWAVS